MRRSGGAAAAVGVLGLLLGAATGAVITAVLYLGEPRFWVNAPATVGTAEMDALAGGGLIVGLTLLGRGHDAGRTATRWLAGAAVPWALLTTVFSGIFGFGDFFGWAIRGPALLGAAAAGVATLALPLAVLRLGPRPSRRLSAGGVAVGRGPEALVARGGPGALVARGGSGALAGRGAAPGRFWTALVLVAVADVALVVVWPLSTFTVGEVDWDWSAGALTVLLSVHGVLLTVAAVGAVGAGAGAGRRRGAVTARVAGAALLLVLPITAWGTLMLGAVAEPDPVAALSPTATAALANALALGFAAGIGLVVTGLAGLAGPYPVGSSTPSMRRGMPV
ncbi:hypothetical protein [Cryptosporangium phraense]|uniref:Uncharacterized protein n=1 Tax=Cryptosporangium phraense TaxID=2593070 RepID=A0A545AL98_9ACTN|nr:hypothetical protein [Cryptosporangium phraense]TQS42061.1 hypothetical protein FL583_26090 [Cryptosporangium phraense]